MTPALIEEKVERFQTAVGSTERVGVSEFARSKEWRERLPEAGCFEVVDRNGVVGYLLDPSCAEALNTRITALEERLEQAQIAAMFKAREQYPAAVTGTELAESVATALSERIDELMELADEG